MKFITVFFHPFNTCCSLAGAVAGTDHCAQAIAGRTGADTRAGTGLSAGAGTDGADGRPFGNMNARTLIYITSLTTIDCLLLGVWQCYFHQIDRKQVPFVSIPFEMCNHFL